METLLLGIIQGLTEFLPVSSSGHLVIFQHWIDNKGEGTLLEVLLHFGTLLATLIVFRKKIGTLIVGLFRRQQEELREIGLIVLASIPTGIIGLTAQKPLSALFESPTLVSATMLVTAGLLWSTRYIPASRTTRPLDAKRAFAVGLFQGIAIIPGISRSGTTICTALHMGVSRERAGEFSFLISLPAIAGAVLLDLLKLTGGKSTGIPIDGFLIGAIFLSFAVGLFALIWLLRFVRQGKMYLFAPYVLLVGLWGVWTF